MGKYTEAVVPIPVGLARASREEKIIPYNRYTGY